MRGLLIYTGMMAIPSAKVAYVATRNKYKETKQVSKSLLSGVGWFLGSQACMMASPIFIPLVVTFGDIDIDNKRVNYHLDK